MLVEAIISPFWGSAIVDWYRGWGALVDRMHEKRDIAHAGQQWAAPRSSQR